MIITDAIYTEMIDSPVRMFRGRVEFYEGSTLTLTCGCHDHLKDFSIERLGEDGKFFGFGVCQKLNVHLIDKNREIQPQPGGILEVVFGIDNDYMYPFPKFYITESHRDEKTNELSITAYDSLYAATAFNVSELGMVAPYTMRSFGAAIAGYLGLPFGIENVDDDCFDVVYENGANFDGSETLREALNYIAEATQTIFYVNHDWRLIFKRLDRDGEPVIKITKDKYFELESGANRRLSNITSATELGDNITATTGVSGTTQFVRDNPFWDIRDDRADALEAAINNIGGITINTFDCDWRGNFLVEIGDKLQLTTKDYNEVKSYLLNDTLNFDGAMTQHTQWNYTDNSMETASNPTTLGEALNHTYARVDKANRQIEMVASQVNAHEETISSLLINTDNITQSVSQVQENITVEINGVNQEIESLRNEVEMKMTSEEVKITIREELETGVDKITTSTGFTFDEVGLTIDKTGSEMTTQITEDGMTVYRSGSEVLVANNEGVRAEDLNATTYLIIGKNSRLENYNNSRTGCFWIGS